MALEHKDLRLIAQREVNGHLVAIEVGVERRTSQWVQLNGLALNELRLERKHRQTVKRRRTVKKHGVTLHHVLQDVPDDRLATVYNTLCALDSLHDAALYELADDERLVQLSGHKLRKTALSHLQLWAHDDNRTGRIVHTLTEEVLTETSLFSLQGVAK